jgi:mycoredoxin
MANKNPIIKLYGTSWCGSTRLVKGIFDRKGIKYEWHDIEEDDDAAKFVEKTNGGYRSVPTIVFPDDSVLVEPSDMELMNKIRNFPEH